MHSSTGKVLEHPDKRRFFFLSMKCTFCNRYLQIPSCNCKLHSAHRQRITNSLSLSPRHQYDSPNFFDQCRIVACTQPEPKEEEEEDEEEEEEEKEKKEEEDVFIRFSLHLYQNAVDDLL